MTYFETSQNPRLKYKNIPQYYNGVRYDSKKEARKAWELDMLKRAGEITGYESHPTIKLMLNGKPAGKNYKIDFIVHWKDGTTEYLEVKSRFTARGTMGQLWKWKWKILEQMLEEDIKTGKVKMTVEY